MEEFDPEKLRICPLSGWTCKPECAWYYRIAGKQGRCAVIILIELLKWKR